MGSSTPALIIWFTAEGRPLKACCSVCGAPVRSRAVKGAEGEDSLSLECTQCASLLAIVANEPELRNLLARWSQLVTA
jgi:hypothetical protein